MAQDIVIVSAARTPVGSFNGTLASQTAAQLGSVALQAAMARAKVEAGEVDEVILGQVLAAGQGQNPARQAVDRRRHSQYHSGLGHEPAVRLGASRRGARHAADRRWRRQDRGCRRPGIDEQGPACGAPAGWREDGRLVAHRHDDQGRIVGRLQRLPYGNDSRERRQAVADHARPAGSSSPSSRRTRRKPPRPPASSRTRSHPSPIQPARAM